MPYSILAAAGLVAMAFVSDTAQAADPITSPITAHDQSAIARRGYFYVGGIYIGEPGQATDARPDVRRGVDAPSSALALSAHIDPWGCANGDQLDGHPG